MNKYRPSNATEGDGFLARFCGRCTKDGACDIPLRTMGYRVEDPEYPSEWVEDERGPRCTAFDEKAKEST